MVNHNQKDKQPLSSSFLMLLPDEAIIAEERQHWFYVVGSIGNIFILWFFTCGLMVFGQWYFHLPFTSLMIGLSSLCLLAGFLVYKEIFEWYYHLYVVTTKKIVEFQFRYFTNRIANTIFLDQVRCTEIDVQLKGLLSTIFNKGNIILTFDRHTHEDEFVIANIHAPHKISHMLQRVMNKSTISGTEFLRPVTNPETHTYFPQFIETVAPNV